MQWPDEGRGEVNVVRTTGIYCRAGCAGRPLEANTARVSSAAAAEASGFRACLRCRPDHLPVVPIDPDADPLVAGALSHIADGFLDRNSDADLGRLMGLSARHLRRLFTAEIGATPAQVARSRRAHFARLLLDDTDLTVTEIAFASGFGSLRRMNEVVKATFRFTPTELRDRRRGADRSSVDGGIRLVMRTSRPVDIERCLAALASGLVPGVESIAGGSYRRTTNVCGHPGVIELTCPSPRHVVVVAHLPALTGLIDKVARCRRLLRLDHIAPGPPGSWTTFEGAIRSIAVASGPDTAPGLLGHLAREHGSPVPGALSLGLDREFPGPDRLVDVDGLPFDPAGTIAAAIRGEAARALGR